MSERITRRAMLGRTGLIVGTVGAAGAVPHASAADTAAKPATKVSEFPYEQHLAPGYRIDAGAVREAAYHAYYAGGCCHGAYSGLLGELARTAGAPFDQLPIDFGKFGAGGIAGYGSICGSILGGLLVTNMIVANPTARAALMTDLLRWYEETPFPAYVPNARHAKEASGVTLDFSATNIAKLQRAPHSHLCHASVSGWCAANRVSASGGDKLARCARLTADVAGRTAETLNAYLPTRAFTAGKIDAASETCLGCHTAASTTNPVAAGMSCTSCHEPHH